MRTRRQSSGRCERSTLRGLRSTISEQTACTRSQLLAHASLHAACVGEGCTHHLALSPNSAPCERVFSLLACMFDPSQKATLSDALQASLMLRYNKREVG